MQKDLQGGVREIKLYQSGHWSKHPDSCHSGTVSVNTTACPGPLISTFLLKPDILSSTAPPRGKHLLLSHLHCFLPPCWDSGVSTDSKEHPLLSGAANGAEQMWEQCGAGSCSLSAPGGGWGSLPCASPHRMFLHTLLGGVVP